MIRCSKCNGVPNEHDVIGWKCNSCGKAFQVTKEQLHGLLLKKGTNPGESFFKCKFCGATLDDGKESIAWKCSCGKITMGKLADFREDAEIKQKEDEVKEEVIPSIPQSHLIKCPECGKEIDSNVKFCPNCGSSLVQEKKRNKSSRKLKIISVVIVGMILFVFALISIYYRFMYRGTFEIFQTNDKIELGSNIDLVSYLQYDPENIIEVKIINDDEFDTKRLGDYSVLFSVKNKRGYIKEVYFEFHVVDTTAPKLSIIKDIVYIPKGNSYNPETNAKANDKDKCTIEVSGEYDLNKEGEYEIFFLAKDESGNVSEKKSMKLVIENRDNCIVRNAKFGDSEEIVKRYETGKILQTIDGDSGGYSVVYEDTVEGEEAYIYYTFNSKSELWQIDILFMESHTDYSIYISNFNSITEKITSKYGEPKVEKGKGSLYSYCSTEEEALSIGQVKYRNTWDSDDISIISYLGNDNYEITFFIRYESKNMEKPDDTEIN